MVTTPANGVFLYQPNNNFAGYYYMQAYSSSGFFLDTQARKNTGIFMLAVEAGGSVMGFNYSSDTGISGDPKLDFSNGNFVMWAHGGKTVL